MLLPLRNSKSVVIVSGSPSATSKTAGVSDFAAEWLRDRGVEVTHVRVRDIPAEALLTGDLRDPTLRRAVDLVAGADGVVLATPTFKASFSGLLKAFIDVLPQFGFRHKTVLPLGTGGSLAHVLSLDYGLRPVMQSMRPHLIVPSVYLLESDLKVDGERLAIEGRSREFLLEILEEFDTALRHAPAVTADDEPQRAVG